MNSLTDPRRHHAPSNDDGLRSAGGFLLMAVIVGAALLLLEFNHELDMASDPVLQDLIGARSHLNRSYDPERHLLMDSRSAHSELSGAIRQLTAAEQQYPAGSGQIDAMRANLQALANGGTINGMTVEELDTRYRKLGSQMEAMIEARLEHRR